jgi:hypothetical protein
MAIKRYKPEQIVTLLRQIEVGIANANRRRKPATRRRSQCRLAEGVRRAEVGTSEADEGTWRRRTRG